MLAQVPCTVDTYCFPRDVGAFVCEYQFCNARITLMEARSLIQRNVQQ